MKVAGSECLARILQYDLQLTAAASPATPDLILFNTCSIQRAGNGRGTTVLAPRPPHPGAGGGGAGQQLVATVLQEHKGGDAGLHNKPLLLL